MDDSEEIDILGDFDYKASRGLSEDDTELPSNSVQLLPEFSQHPWLLEQSWSLDHCADDKSRVAIEKMLLEEQLYIDGHGPESQNHDQVKPCIVSPPTAVHTKSLSTTVHTKSPPTTITKPIPGRRKSSWTEDERTLFFRGFDMFGRRWSKIAELIPSKTHQQVKNYALHHLKNKKTTQDGQLTAPPGDSTIQSQSLSDSVHLVTTGKPTVTVHSIATSTKAHKQLTQHKSDSQLMGNHLSNLDPAKVVYIQHRSASDSDSDVDIEADSDDETVSPLINTENKVSSDHISTNTSYLTAAQNLQNTSDCDLQLRSPGSGCNITDCAEDVQISTPCHFTEQMGNAPKPCISGILNNAIVTHGHDSQGSTHILESVKQIQNVCDHHTAGIPSLTGKDSIAIEESNATSELLLTNCDEAETNNTGSLITADKTQNEPRHTANDTAGVVNTVFKQCASQDHLLNTPANIDVGVTKLENIDSVTETTNACRAKMKSDINISEALVASCPESTDMDDLDKVLENRDISSVVKVPDAGDNNLSETDIRSSGDDDTEEHHGECGILTSDGMIVYLPNPEKELYVDPQHISDEETHMHNEFFTGKQITKTPDRYLKIRNHIIDCWVKCKPVYLNKTAVRSGLKHCGDVNCIGRIHSYLEQIGAINFNCAQVQYNYPCRPLQPRIPREPATKMARQAVHIMRMESMRPRKRRVRDAFGDWVDERDIEGKTIQHKEAVDKELKPVKHRTVRSLYDPFRLIPCSKYSMKHPAPFTVTVTTTALVVMDTHSHLSKTEVIGLLGGQYDKQQGKLVVMAAEPCDSLSTGMQCEMDPVSQTHACESLHTQGMSVIGWYHSHPVFDANPSIRDMETQTVFQNWFASGGGMFIGVIISPYNRQSPSLFSDIRCLMVEKDNTHSNVPFEFEYKTEYRSDTIAILPKIQTLANQYKHYENRVELLQHFKSLGNITCLDKLLHSIESHYHHQEDEGTSLDEQLRSEIYSILGKGYSYDSDIDDT